MIDLQAFHFIRPEWLIAIVPLLVIALLLTKISVGIILVSNRSVGKALSQAIYISI